MPDHHTSTLQAHFPLAPTALEAHNLPMDFEWDTAKDEATRRDRGFGFDFAILIFAGSTIETPDNRRDYGERRVKALGEVDGFVLVVIYTDRGEVRRIISARPASKKERELWQSRG